MTAPASLLADRPLLLQLLPRLLEAADAILPLLSPADPLRDRVLRALDDIRRRILPPLRHDCPLLVAIAGGGSSGKSTLFNTLAGAAPGTPLSLVSSTAGYTRRSLAALHPDVIADPDALALLFARFQADARPSPLADPAEMLAPGPPRYLPAPAISPQLALLDTPDFDTGDTSAFANRDAARDILAASDLILYVFTNQTYNSKANSDFIADALAGDGSRKLVLLYRCSAAYPDADVLAHVRTLLRNLFPAAPDPSAHCLAVYRIDESDAVVRHAAPPSITPVTPSAPPLPDLLRSIDASALRLSLLEATLASALDALRAAADHAALQRDAISAYLSAIRSRLRLAAVSALGITPPTALLALFTDEWKAAQPAYVRASHRISRIVGAPVRFVVGAFRKKSPAPPADPFHDRFRSRFSDIAQKLWRDLARDPLDLDNSEGLLNLSDLDAPLRRLHAAFPATYAAPSSTFLQIPRPASISAPPDGRSSTGQPDFSALATAAADLAAIDTADPALRHEIAAWIRHARSDMTILERLKEGSASLLELVPVIIASAWVAVTSEPISGGTILAKLSSIFGLNDLYALVTIPASFGLDNARRRRLEQFLSGLVTHWQREKYQPLFDLLRSDPALAALQSALQPPLDASEAPLRRLRDALATLDARSPTTHPANPATP